MSRSPRQVNLPLAQVRRYLEPGPIVRVSSACDGRRRIREVGSARAAASPKHPQTLHDTGPGVFVVSGKVISRRRWFRPGML